MKRQIFGFAAIALFITSHFLPAYADGRGYACFEFCWGVLIGHESDFAWGGRLYYSGFVLANLFFLGVTASIFLTKKYPTIRFALALLSFLQVLSWLVLHLCTSPPQINQLQIGYYLWLIAYALSLAAHLRKPQTQSMAPFPNPRKVSPSGARTFLSAIVGTHRTPKTSDTGSSAELNIHSLFSW